MSRGTSQNEHVKRTQPKNARRMQPARPESNPIGHIMKGTLISLGPPCSTLPGNK